MKMAKKLKLTKTSERALYGVLLKNERLQEAMREFFPLLARVRHFYRSHFELLPAWARDYSMDMLKDPDVLQEIKQIIADVDGIKPEEVAGVTRKDAEKLIKEVFERTLQEEGRSHPTGDRAVSGSRASVLIDPKDLPKKLSSAVWVPDGKGDGHYEDSRVEHLGTGTPEWLNNAFPDPFIYFGIKRWLKKLLSTRIRTIQELVRYGVSVPSKDYAKKISGTIADEKLPVFIAAESKRRSARLDRDAKINEDLVGNITDAMTGTIFGLVRFAMEARVTHEVREVLQQSAPGDARDYNLLVNRAKAIRNRYDLNCDPTKSLLGSRLNRKRLSDRLTKTVQHLRKQLGEGSGYNDAVVQDLKRRRLLPYLAHPGAMSHIKPLFAAPDWAAIETIMEKVAASGLLKNSMTRLGSFYPSYARDLKKYETWQTRDWNVIGIPLEEPLNPHALLRAIIQGFMVLAWQNVDPDHPESRNSTNWRKLAIQMTRLVYGMDFISNLPREDPVIANWLGLPEGEVVVVPDYVRRGLSFLLEVPGIMPHEGQSKALASLVSLILTSSLVVKHSLAGKDPQDPTGPSFLKREEDRFGFRKVKNKRTGTERNVPWFSMKGRGFSAAIWDVLGVLAVIKVFGVPDSDLRAFIADAGQAWKNRFSIAAGSGSGPDVFKKILDRCVLGVPPPRKKEFGVVPIPVTKGGDIASLDFTLRQNSYAIQDNPAIGYITFTLSLNLQENVDALNRLLREGKGKTGSRSGGDAPSGPLHPEDPRQWGIGNRVGGKYKTPQDVTKALEYHQRQAGMVANAGGTGKDSFPAQIASLTEELNRCKAAEANLRTLMRRLAIKRFLQKLEDIPKDLIEQINDKLLGGDYSPLDADEAGAFGGYADSELTIKNFVLANIKVGQVTLQDASSSAITHKDIDSLGEWFSTHDQVCNDVGLIVKDYMDARRGKVKETGGNLKKLATALDYHIRGQGIARMSLTSKMRLSQMELSAYQAQGAKKSKNFTPSGVPISARVRYQRALEYLLKLYADTGGFLYKFFHPTDGKFRCKIKLPDPVAWRIYHGAIIGSISLLKPGRGGNIMANIELRGAPSVVHADPLYVSKILDPPLRWPPGGAVGLDDNRLHCPRTFNFGRIPTASNPAASDTDPGEISDGHRVIEPVPGEHLARMAHLWCYGEGGAKVRYGEQFERLRPRPLGLLRKDAGYNRFIGNKIPSEGRGSPFHVPMGTGGQVLEEMEGYCQTVVPAERFFRKIWRDCINATADRANLMTDKKFQIAFPFACPKDESRLRMPTAEKPLDPEADTRAPSTNDQLGTISGFWGVKRLHEYAKIRALQKRETILRKTVSGIRDAMQKVGGKMDDASKAHLHEFIGRLRRVHRDFLDRNARAETTRDAMGSYLSYLTTFFLSQAAPETAANERLGFTAQEGKAQLNALVAAMFKNLKLMLLRAVTTAIVAGAPRTPSFQQVRAAGTSMYHFECGGVRLKRGRVDRRASADFGACRLCGRVVDCHQNASRNIAASHPDYDPPP